MMTRQQIDHLVDTHFQFEQNDDVNGVLKTLSDQVEHDVVGWPPGPSQGPDQARAFYERLFMDLAETRITPVKRLYGEDFVVDESIAESTAVGAPFGLPGGNRRIRFRLLHIFEFEGEQIKRENVWLDLAAIEQQLA